MQHALLTLLVCILLTSCSPVASTSEPTATPALSITPDCSIVVEAWVDKPRPTMGERVSIFGSLIKCGVRLGGMAMLANWPDETQERGVPNCTVQVIYGSGVCTVEASRFPTGQFVPITVIFDYDGVKYYGHTGFTPQ